MKKTEDVNNAMALLFYDQCTGTTDGHMAAIPNSPILHSIAAANGVGTKEQFAEFLRDVADWLDGGGNA